MDFYTDVLDGWNMVIVINDDKHIVVPAWSYQEC